MAFTEQDGVRLKQQMEKALQEINDLKGQVEAIARERGEMGLEVGG